MSESTEIECVVVLGLILDENGDMKEPLKIRLRKTHSFIKSRSHMWKSSSSTSTSTSTSTSPRMVLVLSGGFPAPRPRSEAITMKEFLEETFPEFKEWQDQGFLEIILDEDSLNTVENAYFSRRILLNRLAQLLPQPSQVVVCCTVLTSDFHLPRSSLIFNQVFNAVYDLAEEYPPLKRLRKEKSHPFPPPPPQSIVFDLAFLGPPTPRELTNPNEISYLKTHPAFIAMYETRYPQYDLSRTPQVFFHLIRDGWVKGVADTWRNQPDCINWSENGWSPLHVAVDHGHYALVEFLLSKGADPNLPLDDDSGLTPLHLAAEKLHAGIAHLLLLSGATESVTKATTVEKHYPVDICRLLQDSIQYKNQPKLSALILLLDPANHPATTAEVPRQISPKSQSFFTRIRSGSASGRAGSSRNQPPQPGQKRLFLLRHGQSMANIHHEAMDGAIDAILSEEGTTQCAELGHLLNERRKGPNGEWKSVLEELAPTLVVVSPLSRAIQTYMGVVEPYIKKAGKDKVRTVVNGDLRERICHSSDIGKPASALKRKYRHLDFSGIQEHWWHIPQKQKTLRANMEFFTEDEDDESFQKRLANFIVWLRAQPEERVLIVSHYFTLTRLCELHGSSGNFRNNLCAEVLLPTI